MPGPKVQSLRPFLQLESPLSSQEFGLRLQAQGFELITPILGVKRSWPSVIHLPHYLIYDLDYEFLKEMFWNWIE